jgi:hypothetical protein
MFGSASYPQVKLGCAAKNFATTGEFGAGAKNTASYVAGCLEAGTAGPVIEKFNKDRRALGLSSDWFIPSIDEMRELCLVAQVLGGELSKQQSVLTSTESSGQNGTGTFNGSSSIDLTNSSSCRYSTQTIFNGFPLSLVPMRIQK